MRKGKWDRITEIMRSHGFKAKQGVTPEGLEAEIRDMLNLAYNYGYSARIMDIQQGRCKRWHT